MILEILVALYFGVWTIGFVESWLFARYMRKNHPKIAAEYFPGLFHSSIIQQLRTNKWVKTRSYTDIGDENLTRRADLHRLISGAATKFIFGALIIGAVYSFFFNSKLFK